MVKRTNAAIRAAGAGVGVAFGLAVAVGGCRHAPPPPPDVAHQIHDRDLRDAPPQFASITVEEEAPGGPAGAPLKLVAQAAPAERLPERLTLLLESGPVVLHDDGTNGDRAARDGEFTALLTVPGEHEWLAQQRALAERARAAELTHRFEGRARVTLTRPELEKLVVGDGRVVRLPPFWPPPFPPPAVIDDGKSLMITAPSVVEDPSRTFNPCTGAGTAGGKWTFAHLMREMANQSATAVDPSEFVLSWLKKWESAQSVPDGEVATPRANVTALINAWPKTASGQLDLDRAPFKLLAIVNRVDLRQNLVYGGGSAGEARFVFGRLNAACSPEQMTVIFEYGIKKRGCADLHAWAQQWIALSSLPPASYNAALEAITETFVRANADPAKPNGSALNQLRTNEIAIGSPWELREFHVIASGSDAHHLGEAEVKQTPPVADSGQPIVSSYVSANAAAILAGSYVVPETFGGQPFLAASAPVPSNNTSFHWNGSPPIAYNLRRPFSLGTCNGCHSGETSTQFTHVHPSGFGTAAGLSSFLTGQPMTGAGGFKVVDPAGSGGSAVYNDLQRRHDDLASLASTSCLIQIPHRPLRMTH